MSKTRPSNSRTVNWSSKLGDYEDIEHPSLESLECYGVVLGRLPQATKAAVVSRVQHVAAGRDHARDRAGQSQIIHRTARRGRSDGLAGVPSPTLTSCPATIKAVLYKQNGRAASTIHRTPGHPHHPPGLSKNRAGPAVLRIQDGTW
jgi:hypothetical protein